MGVLEVNQRLFELPKNMASPIQKIAATIIRSIHSDISPVFNHTRAFLSNLVKRSDAARIRGDIVETSISK
jgi:hypothetical protein